ncbi:unnamed protein product [Musa textilis]
MQTILLTLYVTSCGIWMSIPMFLMYLLVVYSKRSNETSIWIVQLSEVHAATRGGHHRGQVISSEVVRDVQSSMVCGFGKADGYSFAQITWIIFFPYLFCANISC